MYPTRLNLLSPEKRKYLRRMIYIQFTKNTLITIVFVFCISGITLLGGQWVLQEYFNDVSSNLSSTNSQHVEKNQKIKMINSIISQTDAIQQTYKLWTPTIVSLANTIPGGIVINNMTLNAKTNTINLNGEAKTRDDLLQMQTNLSSLDFIDNVNIPLSQLTEKINIIFSISATYK